MSTAKKIEKEVIDEFKQAEIDAMLSGNPGTITQGPYLVTTPVYITCPTCNGEGKIRK